MDKYDEVKETIEQITREQKKVYEDYFDNQIRKWVWYCCGEGCVNITVSNPQDSVIFVDAVRYLDSNCKMLGEKNE